MFSAPPARWAALIAAPKAAAVLDYLTSRVASGSLHWLSCVFIGDTEPPASCFTFFKTK